MAVAFYNFKCGFAQQNRQQCLADIVNTGQWRRGGIERCDKLREVFFRALQLNGHALGIVEHSTRQLKFKGITIDKGAKSYPLHYASDLQLTTL